ncbi:expressed unknown protein [Seminavis robusta]|uniref:Uncharacterized protein n=1 Tax=Seminavis robusta TaxID=568900 RepID=A0A9N8E8C6_9STRA|nr:expressed unknown protein [Seminavis robusta]|eukprot:Sro660_g183000.1 n/a (101) ;mRNA; r:23606-23908
MCPNNTPTVSPATSTTSKNVWNPQQWQAMMVKSRRSELDLLSSDGPDEHTLRHMMQFPRSPDMVLQREGPNKTHQSAQCMVDGVFLPPPALRRSSQSLSS